jgi:uncharacterized RDD family membrane protein YckC
VIAEADPSATTSSDTAPVPAQFAVRAVAAIIDGVIAFVVLGIPISAVAGSTTTTANGSTHSTSVNLTGWWLLVWAVLTGLVFAAFEASFGWTPAKRLFGLRVCKVGGDPLDAKSALVRNLLRLIDGFPYVIPYALGAIVAGRSSDRRRVGDRVAGSIVTRR